MCDYFNTKQNFGLEKLIQRLENLEKKKINRNPKKKNCFFLSKRKRQTKCGNP